MKFEVDESFSVWARGFSGCDGGNPRGAIWFCGIEYGGDEDESQFRFDDVSQPKYIREDDLPRILRSQYVIKVAKMYSALMRSDVAGYYERALSDRLFEQKSNAFRMNLYPISFHSDGNERWRPWLYRKTGLPAKSLYRAWCQMYRFREIRRWIENYSPKLIVATGATYRDDFIMAFAGFEELYESDISELDVMDGRRLAYVMVNKNRTLLALTPFLGGRYGLNSDELIRQFGAKISALCSERFGPGWAA